MELKGIDIPEGMVQQVDYEGSFAGITVAVGRGNYIHPHVSLDVLYEDTLEDIEKTLGSVPGFMKFFPKEVLVRDWPSWKRVEEMDMERASYLLSTDDMLYEMLGETQR